MAWTFLTFNFVHLLLFETRFPFIFFLCEVFRSGPVSRLFDPGDGDTLHFRCGLIFSVFSVSSRSSSDFSLDSEDSSSFSDSPVSSESWFSSSTFLLRLPLSLVFLKGMQTMVTTFDECHAKIYPFTRLKKLANFWS